MKTLLNFRIGCLCLAGAGSLAIVPSTWAQVVTAGVAQDAMIFGTSAGLDTGNASGQGPALFAGADGSLNKKRSLIEFDLSAVPANATITGVTMSLTLAQAAGSGGGGGGGNYPSRTIGLYDLLQNWGEGNSGSPTSQSVGGTGQGWPAQNGDSTWDYAFYNSNPAQAVAWSSNGTNLPGGNYSPTASADSTFTSFVVGNSYTWSSPGMVADVQSWVNGTSPNDGWEMISDLEGSATSYLGFWSQAGAVANSEPVWAPSLSITYESVPEPAGLALVAAGISLLLPRRRALAERKTA